MSTDLAVDIKREFLKSKIGISGVLILLTLIVISIFALISIPSAEFQDLNNPEKWISYPKTSVPAWVNIFMFEKIQSIKLFNQKILPMKKMEFSYHHSSLDSIMLLMIFQMILCTTLS